MPFPLIIDAHLDLAYNVQRFGRDYRRAARVTRAREDGTETVKIAGECTVGFPDMLRGRVGLAFATIFVEPASRRFSGDGHGYRDAAEAHALGMAQLDWYRRIAEEDEHIMLVTDRRSLDDLLSDWGLAAAPKRPANHRKRLGLIPLMEGADPILEPKELERWYERGLRLVGPAWDTTRYAGGTWQKGRITRLGRELFDMMARLDVVLDVSHLSHESLYEALDCFEGKHLVATHCNAARFVPNVAGRHLPDDAIERSVKSLSTTSCATSITSASSSAAPITSASAATSTAASAIRTSPPSSTPSATTTRSATNSCAAATRPRTSIRSCTATGCACCVQHCLRNRRE